MNPKTIDSSVQTPRGFVFDPFAPSSDELMFTPRKKSLKEPRTGAVRQLDFDYCDISMEEVGENEAVNPKTIDSSGQTPRGFVFDPFAPSSDELMFAPRKKSLEEPRTSEVRLLDFDNSDVAMEEVGKNEVKVAAANQAEEILAENLAFNLDCGGFKTPASSPPLKGVAETCPGGPMKRAREPRKYDPAICRKLEFGSRVVRNEEFCAAAAC